MKPVPSILTLITLVLVAACNTSSNTDKMTTPKNATNSAQTFIAGKDYLAFDRVKIMDEQAFSQPAEAYSILLPQGWQSQGGVIWTPAGSSCAGTNMQFAARSPDGKSMFNILPATTWMWSTNQQMNEMSRQQGNQGYCSVGEPMTAEQYLQQVWIRDLGNATIVEIKPNPDVVQSMSEMDNESRTELMRYGASQVNFRHTAITARIRFNDGRAAIVTCGVTNAETYIPNVYNGTYDISYTSSARRTQFTYPENGTEEAEKIMSVLTAGFRTNPDWKQATNDYWRNVREQKQVAHLGKIRLMDEQTRRIGQQAIANGNQRLAQMDNQMRSWESQQSSQDRAHTNFIKTIREVENYRDQNGTVELSSGYNHAWSRSDGSSYIMTNSPNFNPSSVFQDQQWAEMQKVD